MSRRPLRSGRLLTWGLLLGAAAAALAPAGPDALVPFKILAASAADDVFVAVIIDFGNGSNISSISKCVPVASGSTDADALAAAVGESNVAYSSSGLVCSIDGYPADGVQSCNASAGSNYYFWSYWHGATGSWAYANDGPAEHPAADGDVEGWHFLNPGPANPSAPPPGPAPNYTAICGVHVPSNTTTTTSTQPTNSASTTTVAPSAGPGTTPTTPGGAGGTGSTKGQTGTSKGSSTTSRSSGSTTTTAARGAGQALSTSPRATTTTTSRHDRLAASNTVSHHPMGSSGGAWLPILIVTLTAVTLALMAVLLIRRRPAEE
jgi:hypothetical protein